MLEVRDNVDITLGDGTLRIEAEKKEEKTEDGETWYMRERSFGKYSRLIETPSRRNHAAPLEARRQQAGRKLTSGTRMSYSFFGQGVNPAGSVTCCEARHRAHLRLGTVSLTRTHERRSREREWTKSLPA